MANIKTKKNNTLLRPRITEKATNSLANGNVYVFEVFASSNKKSIMASVKDLYKVTPVKVNIVNLPAKNIIVRGKKGKTASIKKAYIYLKEGDKIEI